MHALSPDGMEKWVKRVGTGVYRSFSSPSVGSDGTVYVGTDSGRAVAIKPDGNVKWYVNTGKAIHCTPAIAKDGTIIFGSYNGFVYAVHPDCKLKWSFKTSNWVESSPAIDSEGTVYIGSSDGNSMPSMQTAP